MRLSYAPCVYKSHCYWYRSPFSKGECQMGASVGVGRPFRATASAASKRVARSICRTNLKLQQTTTCKAIVADPVALLLLAPEPGKLHYGGRRLKPMRKDAHRIHTTIRAPAVAHQSGPHLHCPFGVSVLAVMFPHIPLSFSDQFYLQLSIDWLPTRTIWPRSISIQLIQLK